MRQVAQRLGWNRRGITVLEVALMVAAVSVLVVALVPALGRARATAQVAASQSTMNVLYIGLMSYADDNAGYTPVNAAINGGDFTPPTLGKSPAGKDIWGVPPGMGGGTQPAPGAVNKPLGHGALVTNAYVGIEDMYVPPQRVDTNKWWVRRIYFGDPLQTPWSDPPNDPGPWSPWYGGGNYWFEASFTFRSGDWSTFVFDANKRPVKVTPQPVGTIDGAIANAKLIHTRPSTPGYTTRSLLVDNSGAFYQPLKGGNVCFGDGSVVFWESHEHWAGVYTRNWQSSYPRNPLSGDSFHGGFRSLLMDAADNFAR